MRFKHIFILTVPALLGLAACNENKVFEKEQYKNVFGFISDEENMNSKVFSLHKAESEGYLSFSMGGTNNITEDVTINIVEDPDLIETYNRNNYDQDVAKYAKQLPKDKYEISSMQCVIKAGQTGGVIPVKIRPAGLSPDTTYLIPIRVDTYDRCEINPDKCYMLYRVQIENRWAVGDGTTNYTLRGKRRILGDQSELSMPGTKILFPLTANRVRTMVGNETYAADEETLYRGAMILEIADNGKVKILPYRDVEIVQLDNEDPEYPNKFFIDDDGFNTYKTFLLCYQYTFEGVTYVMKEELRLQFNPDEEEDYEDTPVEE